LERPEFKQYIAKSGDGPIMDIDVYEPF
jgi:hypothetical protein